MLNDATQNPPAISKYLRGGTLIALATFALYLPAIFGSFIWDDPDYVVNNLSLRSLYGLWQIWTQPSASPQYYPLVFSGFWLEYHLWGLHPFGYHVINVALHAGSALLLWRIVDELNLPGGWLAAAIFATHPVHVESVAWISERKNVLSAVFYLLALRIYLRPITPARWWSALALFVAALLSKSVTASWPAAVLVISWWRDGAVRWRDVIRLLPFFVLAVLSGAVTTYVEHSLVGATGSALSELNLSFADRLVIAGKAVWFYAGKLLLPWPLTFIYPRWRIDGHSWLQWIPVLLLPLLLLGERAGERVLAFQSSRKESMSGGASPRVQREGERRAYPAVTLLFIGSLFPALGFINVYPMRYSFVADHFQYLASLALIVPMAGLLVKYFRSASAIVLIPLAVLTSVRAGVFAAPLTLWSDTYSKNPNSWMVCTNLANTFNAQRDFDAAGDLFVRAYELAPQLYETQTNAAIVFARRGQTQRAIALLESSARINPDFPFTYFNWGQVLENNDDPNGAIEKYQRAIELAPEFPAARQRMAALKLRRQRSSTQGSGDASRQ